MHLTELLDSPALDLLLSMERDELQIEATDANTIRISPVNRLDMERLGQVRRYKPELLQLLRICDGGVQARLALYRGQLEVEPAPQIPAFVFRADVPCQAGACFSCGDALLRAVYGRCWRCALAFQLAVGAELPSTIAPACDEAKLAG